jgi:hypothetical protein
MDGEGVFVGCVRIDNSVPNLVAEVAKAGPGAEVAVQATYGWDWAVDALSRGGFAVTLAHPRGIPSMQNRRAKTDQLGAKGWRICCGSAGWRRRGSSRRGFVSCDDDWNPPKTFELLPRCIGGDRQLMNATGGRTQTALTDDLPLRQRVTSEPPAQRRRT